MNNKLYNLFETESQYFKHSNKSSYKGFNHMNITVVIEIQFDPILYTNPFRSGCSRQ